MTRSRRLGVLLVAVMLSALAPLPAASTARAAAGAFVGERPVPGDVVRLASIPQPNWLPGHRGVDLEAQAGDEVRSPAAGTVTVAGTVVHRGVVAITHAGGFVTALEPVTATVAVGDVVAAGQSIGTVSDQPGHCGASPCVHWGLRRDGVYVDPLDYLSGFGQIRLLPVSR